MCFQYFFHLFAFSSFCFFIFSLLKQRWRKSQSASFFHFPRLTLALSLHCSRILAPVSLLSSSLLSSPCSRLPAPVSLLPSLLSFYYSRFLFLVVDGIEKTFLFVVWFPLVVEVKFGLFCDLQCSSWLLVEKNDLCKGFRFVMFTTRKLSNSDRKNRSLSVFEPVTEKIGHRINHRFGHRNWLQNWSQTQSKIRSQYIIIIIVIIIKIILIIIIL